jgi:hypothetical protein
MSARARPHHAETAPDRDGDRGSWIWTPPSSPGLTAQAKNQAEAKTGETHNGLILDSVGAERETLAKAGVQT